MMADAQTGRGPKEQQQSKAAGAAADAGGVAQRFADAYAEYARGLQEVWSSEEVARSYRDAMRQFADLARGSGPLEEVRRRTDRARTDYLRSVKDAWSSIDPEALEPTALAAIGQSLQAAAWMAACQPREADEQQGRTWGWS
jgi:hypothetical protein